MCLLVLLVKTPCALAEPTSDNLPMPTVDHSKMLHHAAQPVDHSKMHHDTAQPVDHSKMHHDNAQPVDHSKMQHGAHGSSEHTDHSSSGHEHSNMQGGDAPPDARDPHAYADGYDFGPIPRPKMGDEEFLSSVIVDRLESVTSDNTTMTYDLQAWVGKTYDKALIRTEGDVSDGKSRNGRHELLWAHALTPYWDTHLGVRYDSGVVHDRTWLALGVQGYTPYWVYVEATAYVGEQGRTAFRLETEYDLYLTQRLILQPRIEVNFYGKRDDTRRLGNGVSDLETGLRLRYEIIREIAPYVGVDWASTFGDTATYAKTAGNSQDQVRFVAGVHVWF